ncbi:glycosylphosphatidylinositol anchor attachment 1 protein-like [Patiria miniata]|uniref:Glycosylphosphatidylinositol anchor attachment 1 protein n=1 Tax=Patiria miniata TaxID=46514 RepID=A0A913Z3E7_PATMI|nr:glycosylphosphatidylinositol anchor attachment 1 protein-like [Patiria miniata]XP_038046353.1 glycosylphosphatidylinositol anchor attachment 1 protein-like [Patiria miniata]
MGLMTDPYTQAVLATFIGRFHKVGSLLCYVAGVAYMLALAYPTLNAGTYFSENALLPGLVDREYADSSYNVEQLAEEYKKVIDGGEGLPVAYMETKFTQLGLDTYTQNFSVKHPFLETEVIGKRRVPKTIQGTNVYAILRAPRIAGTEAIVLMVPYRSGKKAQERGDTHFGIGLMLSLAKFFQTKTYWSKDLIFLVVDQEDMGMQAWLEAYQGIPSDYISSSIMQGRSGAIMGAVNLEVGVPRVKRLDLVTEGINGHLPNLDLFNLVVRLCGKEGVQASFQNQVDSSNYHRLTRQGYEKSAKTMLLNMAHQATGQPRAIHGLFLHYHIEAITIRAAAGQKSGSKSMQVVGRVLEGVIRSINNLLERLHQSFFFYVLPNCDRYVSIGLYMPPFALLMMVPLLNGLALWIKSGSISKSLPTKDSGKETPKTDSEITDDFVPRPLSTIMPLLIGASVTGALLYISPEFFMSRLGNVFKLTPEELVSLGVMALFVGGAMFPHIIRRKMSSPSDPGEVAAEWQLLKSFALIWQAVILSAISMMNFSLAFFISVAMVPISAVVKPSSRTPLRLLNAVLLLLISPPVLLFLFLAIFNAATSPISDGGELLSTTLQMSKHALYRAVVDGYVFGNLSYGLATMVVFPNWLMLWLVVWKKV